MSSTQSYLMRAIKKDLTNKEKRKLTRRTLLVIFFLLASLSLRALLSSNDDLGANRFTNRNREKRTTRLNNEFGQRPLYAFGNHHEHHQFRVSPHELALLRLKSSNSDLSSKSDLSSNRNVRNDGGAGIGDEQKQFSLRETKIYVYSSRDIQEISKLAPKDCERVESEQLLHRMFLYSNTMRARTVEEATHFFVPAYPECLREQKKISEREIERLYVNVLSRMPRFQMSGGLDHVLVAPRSGIDTVFPEWRKHCSNCLFLRASRDVRGQTTDLFREIVIPDAFSESDARKNDEEAERLKSKRSSHALISVLGDDEEAKRLRKIHKVSDSESMRFSASFCVVVIPNDAEGEEDIGSIHWTRNIALALWSDCIPVLLHKKISTTEDDGFANALLDALPLADVLDYESFAISQAYKSNSDDDELLDYLRSIKAEERREFSRNGKRVRCAFVYDAGDSECSAALALAFALGKRALEFPKSSKSFWGAHGIALDGDGKIIPSSSSSSSATAAAATLAAHHSSASETAAFETENVFIYAPKTNDLNRKCDT